MHGRLALTALDHADVRAVQASGCCHGFLGHAAVRAEGPQEDADGRRFGGGSRHPAGITRGAVSRLPTMVGAHCSELLNGPLTGNGTRGNAVPAVRASRDGCRSPAEGARLRRDVADHPQSVPLPRISTSRWSTNSGSGTGKCPVDRNDQPRAADWGVSRGVRPKDRSLARPVRAEVFPDGAPLWQASASAERQKPRND